MDKKKSLRVEDRKTGIEEVLADLEREKHLLSVHGGWTFPKKTGVLFFGKFSLGQKNIQSVEYLGGCGTSRGLKANVIQYHAGLRNL